MAANGGHTFPQPHSSLSAHRILEPSLFSELLATKTRYMGSEQEQPICFSHLEDDLHSAFTKAPFVEGAHFTSLFQELDLYCESAPSTENDKPLVVVGDSGVGKSAALANWAARRVGNAPPTRNRLDFSEYVFYHAIGCSRLSTQVIHLLRRLVNSIIFHFQLNDTTNLADEKLPWILPRLLERASKKGRVVICLDGLHNICSKDKDFGLKWLPISLPIGGKFHLQNEYLLQRTKCCFYSPFLPFIPIYSVKMIVSATTPIATYSHQADQNERISDHSKKFQVKVQHTWNEIQRRKWPSLPLESTQVTCVANFIDNYLSSTTQYSREQTLGMRAQAIETVCAHPLATNPLFVNVLIRGLFHAIGLGFNVNKCLAAWMPCRTTAELFEHVLLLFESGTPRKISAGGDNSNLLGWALCLLFVARHGLHERELIELLDLVQQQSIWNSQTSGTAVPVKLKILNMLMKNKQRLIDIFRSFDKDGNG